jgi:hypothetical protein
MNWFLQNWQPGAAMAIVGLTVALFVRHILRRRRSACGEHCECVRGEAQVVRTRRSDNPQSTSR